MAAFTLPPQTHLVNHRWCRCQTTVEPTRAGAMVIWPGSESVVGTADVLRPESLDLCCLAGPKPAKQQRASPNDTNPSVLSPTRRLARLPNDAGLAKNPRASAGRRSAEG